MSIQKPAPTNYNRFNQAEQIQSFDDAQHMSAREFGMKFKSSKESHKFLSMDCNLYTPPFQHWKQIWTKEVLAGRKL